MTKRKKRQQFDIGHDHARCLADALVQRVRVQLEQFDAGCPEDSICRIDDALLDLGHVRSLIKFAGNAT